MVVSEISQICRHASMHAWRRMHIHVYERKSRPRIAENCINNTRPSYASFETLQLLGSSTIAYYPRRKLAEE